MNEEELNKLFDFYSVDNKDDLIVKLTTHIEKLQDKAVKLRRASYYFSDYEEAFKHKPTRIG